MNLKKERGIIMEKYIGTKIIDAEESTLGEYWESVKYPKELRSGNPEQNGYLVIYPDGYVSWSPKEVFEAVYHKAAEGMSFGEAIEAAKAGHKISRKGWNGKGQYVELASSISYTGADGKVVNADHSAIGNRAFAFVGTSGIQMGWLASQADMLAEGWMLAE